jgi:hypothetical protein
MTGLVLTYTNRLALAEERANLIRSVLLNARGEGQLKAS